MRTEKLSLTLEKELHTAAGEVGGARGLSTYVNRANQLQHDRLAALLAEFEKEQGPIDSNVMERVRQEWLMGERPAGF